MLPLFLCIFVVRVVGAAAWSPSEANPVGVGVECDLGRLRGAEVLPWQPVCVSDVAESCDVCQEEKVLQFLQASQGNFVTVSELSALYPEPVCHERVFEDVVDLMRAGYNIECDFEHRQCILYPGGCVVDSGFDGRELFASRADDRSLSQFCVARQTYILYKEGCVGASLWKTAVFRALFKCWRSYTSSRLQKLERILVLTEDVVRHGCFQKRVNYRHLPDGDKISSKDVKVVRRSLTLYAKGRNILDNMPEVRFSGRSCVGAISHPEVLDYLSKNEGKDCSESDLLKVITTTPDHVQRNLYQTIFSARQDHQVNIVHDELAGTFSLRKGVWNMKRGSWAKVLWEMLEGVREMPSDCVLGMRLSDQGYEVILSQVAIVKTVKKLSGAGLFGKFDDDFLRKKAVWDTVVEEKKVCGRAYYAERGLFVTEGDLATIKRGWKIYQSDICHEGGVLSEEAESLKDFLISSPSGVTVRMIQEHLHKTQQACAWRRVSDLMRNGYAGNVVCWGKSFFWDWSGQDIDHRDDGLLEDLCAMPYEDFKQGFGKTTFLLHKKGHLDVGPQDVKRLTDVLFITGRIRHLGMHNVVVDVWDRLQRKEIDQPTRATRGDVAWLCDLDAEGFLDKIRNHENVDVSCLLKKRRLWGRGKAFTQRVGFAQKRPQEATAMMDPKKARLDDGNTRGDLCDLDLVDFSERPLSFFDKVGRTVDVPEKALDMTSALCAPAGGFIRGAKV